jgi:myo-inositol-1(or 4)-monophosphatase
LTRLDDLSRIREGLTAASEVVQRFVPGNVSFDTKEERGDPVTAADHAVDQVLRDILPRPGEGWLSEESVDDESRLGKRRVWVVDPIDGTREFVDGVPEWCISIGLVEEGVPVAGGIFNPVTGDLVVGSLEHGVTHNGSEARVREQTHLDGVTVLASRSELRRGEWDRFAEAPFEVRPCGSVAYKMALVAAGVAEATWTLVPKSEWDVAAGTALVRAAGGRVALADGSQPRFNREKPVFPNLIASGPRTFETLLSAWIRETE